jgi:hypothetical protein
MGNVFLSHVGRRLIQFHSAKERVGHEDEVDEPIPTVIDVHLGLYLSP